LKVQHSKCCVPKRHRGFESHPLRHGFKVLSGQLRKGAGAVDLARLESACAARHRGFESLPFRQNDRARRGGSGALNPQSAIAGSMPARGRAA
jgi:hypothetical protein